MTADPLMRTVDRALGFRAAVLSIGLLLWSEAAMVADPSPPIEIIDAKVLDTTATAALEDTEYWTVVGEERPQAANVDTFSSADKAFVAGVSRYDRMTLELRDWPIDEFMYILEGQVEITPEGGQARTYGPGDAFVMPKGFKGTWRQLSPLRKIQVSYARAEN
jgi:uncharacterized cupin superfamily protein